MEQRSAAKCCSVFAFIEAPHGIKMGAVGAPKSMGKYVTTHSRHFIQKASYTISTCWDQAANMHLFCPHEYNPINYPNQQDFQIKITIPRSDRSTALRELDEFNINHYTLFQTEDAMIRAFGLRVFELD